MLKKDDCSLLLLFNHTFFTLHHFQILIWCDFLINVWIIKSKILMYFFAVFQNIGTAHQVQTWNKQTLEMSRRRLRLCSRLETWSQSTHKSQTSQRKWPQNLPFMWEKTHNKLKPQTTYGDGTWKEKALFLQCLWCRILL